MKLVPFVYAPMRRFGELVRQYEDELHDAPAADRVIGGSVITAINKIARDLNYRSFGGADQWGAVWRDGKLLAKGRFLYRLNDVTVIRGGPLGPHAWHIALEKNICALEACPRGNRDLAGTEGIRFQFGEHEIGVNVIPWHDEIFHETRPAIFYGSDFDNNYYHKVFDTLPRSWAEFEGLTPPDAIWYHADKPAVRYDELWFPSWWPAVGYSPAPVRWLRDQPRSTDGMSGMPVLYFPRRDVRRRRVLNEASVLTVIEEVTGGECTVAETGTMTLEQQQAAVANARIIVAPHGAALANLVWAKRCAVIELVPEGFQHPVYQYAAKWSGHWYGRLICPSVENDCMMVDTEALAAIIGEAWGVMG